MGLGFMPYSRAGELSSVVMLDSVHVPVRKINLEETLVMYCSVSEYTCICIKRTRFFFKISSQLGHPPPPKKYDMRLGDTYYFNWETFKYPFVKVSHINIYSYYIFTYKIFVSGFHNTL